MVRGLRRITRTRHNRPPVLIYPILTYNFDNNLSTRVPYNYIISDYYEWGVKAIGFRWIIFRSHKHKERLIIMRYTFRYAVRVYIMLKHNIKFTLILKKKV